MKTSSKDFERWFMWMGILMAALSAWWIVVHYEMSEVWIRKAGWLGPLVSIGLYALLSLTPIPSDPLTLLNGVLFGWQKGLLISWIGNNAAALVEYLVFRNISDLTRFDRKLDQLPEWIKKWPIDSVWFLIVGRLLPGFGGKIVSVMAGMYKVSWWKYFWTTAIANLAGSLLYLFSGWGIIQGLQHFFDWISKIGLQQYL